MICPRNWDGWVLPHYARLGETLLGTVICLVLGGGERLQRPDVGVQEPIPLVFYTDAKAEDGRAWIGGFLDKTRDVRGPGSR